MTDIVQKLELFLAK